MNSTSQLFSSDTGTRPTGKDIIRTYREDAALEAAARLQRRSLELEEQRSVENAPQVRIRVWEKIHGLRLPASAAHPILDVIAADTGLTRTQVLQEQCTRFSEKTDGGAA